MMCKGIISGLPFSGKCVKGEYTIDNLISTCYEAI